MQTPTGAETQAFAFSHPESAAAHEDGAHWPQYGSEWPFITQCMEWVKTCADYYAAASAYEQLSGLSDAELRRRGLSRATLARDVSATCARYSGGGNDGRF
jgi:hypothetical protein